MNSRSEYLPQYTLAQLSEQVCMKLPYFAYKFNAEIQWQGIIQQCQLIEEEPRNVNIVTADASKHSEFYAREGGVRVSHVILVRIYTEGAASNQPRATPRRSSKQSAQGNAPKEQQAVSPGQRPGYAGQRNTRPVRAKASGA